MGCTTARNVKTLKERSQKFSDKFNELLKQNNIDLNKSILPYINVYYDRNYAIEKNNIDNLICPICYNILKNPICCSANEKSHSFCQDCIDLFIQSNHKECPICRQNFEYKTNDKIKDELSKISFQCIYNNEGCHKILPYNNYLKHIYICKFSNYLHICNVQKFNYKKRNFESCGFKGNIHQMEEHFKKCALFKYKCNFCNKNVLRINLKEHMEKECKKICFIDMKDGTKYVGEYLNGKPNGFGILYHLQYGTIYEGQFKDGCKNGYGKSYYNENFIYVGEWNNNKKEGYGCLINNDITIYNGYFKNGLRDGFGILKNGGFKYVGEFKNDKFNGLGYSNDDGEIAEGVWVDNTMTGFGITQFDNGDKYIGDWIGDKTIGIGITYFSNGGIYEGEHGPDYICGTFYYPNGEKHEGISKDFILDGYGIHYFKDGKIKTGKFYQKLDWCRCNNVE